MRHIAIIAALVAFVSQASRSLQGEKQMNLESPAFTQGQPIPQMERRTSAAPEKRARKVSRSLPTIQMRRPALGCTG